MQSTTLKVLVVPTLIAAGVAVYVTYGADFAKRFLDERKRKKSIVDGGELSGTERKAEKK